jgi:hypothetical protein
LQRNRLDEMKKHPQRNVSLALWLGVAAGAAVPETSVHEYGDLVVGEQEVGLAGQPACLVGVANAETSGNGANPALGRGSLGGDAAHAL